MPSNQQKEIKIGKRWISLLLFGGSLSLTLLVLGENIYQSQRPPTSKGPVINVEAVKERIKEAGLSPREARYYKIVK